MIYRHTSSTAPVFSFRHILGALPFGLLCLFLTLQIPAADAAEVVDRIVAVVNDEIIVLQEVDTQVNNYIQSMQQQIEAAGYTEEQMRRNLSDLRKKIIKQAVNERLIIQAAKENEYIEVNEEQIDAQIQNIKEQNSFTDEQFLEWLDQLGYTLEKFRTELEEQSLSDNIIYFDVTSKIVITNADVSRYYNEHPEKYRGKTTFHLRNILVKAPASDSAAAKAAVQNKLANIFKDLEAGQSFESVARKHSEFANAGEGGELGNFELKDLLESFRTAIEPLSPGEYTQAIETSDGYQIFYVQEINKESDKPLDSVLYSEIEKELRNQQYQDKLQAWIEDLRENAHIVTLE